MVREAEKQAGEAPFSPRSQNVYKLLVNTHPKNYDYPMFMTYTIDISKPQDPQMERVYNDFGCSGVSPGYAADYLGVSRQAVRYACENGALRSCKLMMKKGKKPPKLAAILIDTASLDAYKELRDLNGGRIPYRAKAI